MSITNVDVVVAEQGTAVEPPPARTTHVGRILKLAASSAGTRVRHLWAHYGPRLAFGEEGVALPPSGISFTIVVLLAFVEIGTQSQPGFPFQTHPRLIKLSVTSLIMYGFASAVELVVYASGLDHTSVFAIVARLGRIGSLCVLIAFIASLFYF